MKKISLHEGVKQKKKEKAFNEIEKIKSDHSKVRNVKHYVLEYLIPNENKIIQNECQLIFKLKCNVTEAKVNMH